MPKVAALRPFAHDRQTSRSRVIRGIEETALNCQITVDAPFRRNSGQIIEEKDGSDVAVVADTRFLGCRINTGIARFTVIPAVETESLPTQPVYDWLG